MSMSSGNLGMHQSTNLPAPATTMFCFGKSIIGLPCALTAPRRPAIATPAVPCMCSKENKHVKEKTVNR